MALVVEDGTGRSDAESYSSVADADNYLLIKLAIEGKWRSESSESQKEASLRIGTRFLDGLVSERLKGIRSFTEQGLALPRTGMWVGGTLWPYNKIPREFKEACIELANMHREGNLPTMLSAADRGVASKTVKADTALKSVVYSGSAPEEDYYLYIEQILKEYLISAGGTVVRG